MSLSSASRALLRARPSTKLRRLAQVATVTSSAPKSAPSCPQPNPTIQSPLGQPHFPCVEAHKARESRLTATKQKLSEDEPGTGPEPSYARPNPTTYQVYHHSEPFPLVYYPKPLPSFDIAYETWGTLSPQKDNVILLHTGLSASSHAASTPLNPAPGWWEKFIGPGKPIDTDKYFVICTNVLGGCYGSTGPSSIEPETGKPWATRFPIVSIFDMVKAQFHLLGHLGVEKLYASVGCSMGAMQSLAAGWLFPARVGKVVSISGTARSSPSAVAMRFAQRSVLMADPNWNNGFYYDSVPPHTGMKLARQIATITYRSGPEWDLRFGRQMRAAPPDSESANGIRTPALCPDFLIETYLDHQGEQFCLKYDANSLLYVSKAMDLFDMTAPALKALKLEPLTSNAPHGEGLEDVPPHKMSHSKSHPPPVNPPPHLSDLAEGMKPLANIPTLVLGVQSDILFTVEQQREVADALRMAGNENVSYYELGGVWGHDTFLIDKLNVGGAILSPLNNANDPDLDGFDTISDLSSVTEDPSSQTPTPQSSRLLSLKTSSTLSSLAAKRKHLLRRSLSALENFPKEFSSLIHSHSFPRRFHSQRQRAQDDSMNDLQLRPSLDMKLPCSHADLDERPSRRTKLESRIYNFLTRSRSRSRSKQEQQDSSPSSKPERMHRESLDQRRKPETTSGTPNGSKPASRIPSRPLSSTTSTTNSTAAPSTPRGSKRTPSGLPTPKVAPTQQQVRENAAPSSRPTTPKSSVTKKTIHNLFGIPLALRRSSRSRSRSRPSSPQPSLKPAKDTPPIPSSGWYDDNPTPKARKPLPSPLISRNPSPSPKPKPRASDPSPSLKLPKLFSGRTSTSTTASISGASSLQPRPPSTAASSSKPSTSVSLPLKRPTAHRRSAVPEPPPPQSPSSSSHTRSGSGSALPNGKAVQPPKSKESPPPSAMKPVSKVPSAPPARHGGHASSKNASMDASYRYRGGNMSIVEEESSIRTSVRTSLDYNNKPATPSLKGKAREETTTPTSHLRPPTKMSASVRSTKHGSFDFERPGWLQRTGSNGTAISNLSEKSNYTAVTAPPASGDHHHHKEKELRESTASGSGPGLAGVGTVQRDLSLKRAKDTEEQFRARERAQRLHEYVQRDKSPRIPAANGHHSLGHARREGSTHNHSDHDANAHSTSTNATARTKDSSAGRASGKRIASAMNGPRAGGSGSGIGRLMGTAHHGLFSWEPPVPSPTRSTTSNGDVGSSSRGGSADRSGTSREDKLKYSGLSKGDRPAVPVPTSSSIPQQRPGHRGRSLDLGIGLAWAPSTVKEEALIPSSLFARSASHASSGGRSASGSTSGTGKSASSSANGGGGHEFGSNGSRSKRIHIQDGVDLEAERTRMGKEVAEVFKNVLDDRGYNAFKSYVRQFDAHEIPFDGPKGIVERVERLLRHAPDRGQDNRALLDKFVRIILQNA